jgi:hypothetical protein
MNRADYGLQYNDECQNVDDGNMPYFALYNIHTGTLRTFIYVNKNNYTGDEKLIVTVRLKRAGQSTDATGYGLFINSEGRTLSERGSQQAHEHVLPAYYGHWTVFDQEASFDDLSPIEDGMLLEIGYDGVSESEINLGGEFYLEKEAVLSKESGGLEAIGGDLGKVVEKFDKPSAIVNGLAARGDKMAESSSSWTSTLGGVLKGLATELKPLAPWVGVALAGYGVYDAYSGSEISGSSAEFYDGAIELSGSIV